MTYFLKGAFKKNGSLEKADPMPKFDALVKTTFITNQSLLISNRTILFQTYYAKYPNKAF